MSPSSSRCNMAHLAGRLGRPAQPQQRGWDPKAALEACPTGCSKVTISLQRVSCPLPKRLHLYPHPHVRCASRVLPSEGRKPHQSGLLLSPPGLGGHRVTAKSPAVSSTLQCEPEVGNSVQTPHLQTSRAAHSQRTTRVEDNGWVQDG